MAQSINQPVISSLIESFQRKLEPAKVYDAVRRMNSDLDKAYNALFFGPLPAVDGNNLTNLNARNLTGFIKEENVPDNIAFQDRENLFSDLNTFVNEDESSIALGFGTVTEADEFGQGREYENEPTSFFHMGAIADGEFYLGQNYRYDGSDFERDNESLGGLILEFDDGQLEFKTLLPADAFDYPEPYLANTFRFEAKNLWIQNYEQDDTVNIIFVDPHWDIILLGGSAGDFADDWVGHIAIPNKATPPVIDGGEPTRLDGVICIDKTTSRLCYYTNGGRFRITGAAF